MTAADSALRFADIEPALDMSLVANATEGERYRMPDNEGQWAQELPVNVFDAEGELTPEKMAAIKLRFATLGTLQVINTGIRAAEQNDVPMNILEGLGIWRKFLNS